MATLAGGRCLRMSPDLYVSCFSWYSSSEIFRTFTPHIALARSAYHCCGSGRANLLRFGTELEPLSGIRGMKATIASVSEKGSRPQTRPMSPRYNPWRQRTHSPSQMLLDNGLRGDSSVLRSSGGTNHRLLLYTVTRPRTASVTSHGRPSTKINPGIPGRANAEAIAGWRDGSCLGFLTIQRRAIEKMRMSSKPGYIV